MPIKGKNSLRGRGENVLTETAQTADRLLAAGRLLGAGQNSAAPRPASREGGDEQKGWVIKRGAAKPTAEALLY